jgi:hypothetical protein
MRSQGRRADRRGAGGGARGGRGGLRAVKTPARHYRPTLNQFLAGHRMVSRREFWRFEAPIIAILIGAYSLLALFPEVELRDDVSLRGAVLSVVVAVLGYMFLEWLRFKKKGARLYEAMIAEPPVLYSIRDEGFEVSGSNTYELHEWRLIDHWSETSDSVFLFGRTRLVGVYLSLIVSKNQLSPQDLRFLLDRLDENGIPKR